MRILGTDASSPFRAETYRNVEIGSYSTVGVEAYAPTGYSLQSCGRIKKIQCAARVAAVVGICYESLGLECLAAIAELGDCCDCLPSDLRQYC
jgi:hypothetical protein